MAFDGDYSNRKGFDTAFLRPAKQDGQVFLPQLSPALAKKAAPLTANTKDNVLKYRHFSVVMHKARRFAIYSAANVDFSGRFQLTRPKDSRPRLADGPVQSAAADEPLVPLTRLDQVVLQLVKSVDVDSHAASANTSAQAPCSRESLHSSLRSKIVVQ